MRVSLRPIARDNWRSANNVRAAPGQLRFVASTEPVSLVILAKAYLRVADFDWHPLAVCDDEAIVGVVAVVDEIDRHGQLAFFHLLIDREYQRRGFGRAAVRSLVSRAEATVGCTRLRLTVVPGNAAAIALYESEGFVHDGVGDDGELRMFRPTERSA